jgi:predicted aconitase with swiveling domain
MAVVMGPAGQGSDQTDRRTDAPAGTEIAKARVLVGGSGRGPLLRLRAPISFWGGVDPVSGRIADPRHPDHGAAIGGTVLVVPAAVGSSSSSAILLELIREGTAPAAVVMGKADAILALGVVVARELGHSGPPVLELSSPMLDAIPEGVLEVLEDGTLRRVG